MWRKVSSNRVKWSKFRHIELTVKFSNSVVILCFMETSVSRIALSLEGLGKRGRERQQQRPVSISGLYPAETGNESSTRYQQISQPYTVYCIVFIRVEWYSTFCDFRKATHFCRSGIFLGVHFQKNGNPKCTERFFFIYSSVFKNQRIHSPLS